MSTEKAPCLGCASKNGIDVMGYMHCLLDGNMEGKGYIWEVILMIV